MLKVTELPSPSLVLICHLFYATNKIKNATMFYAPPPTNFEIYMPPTLFTLNISLSNKNLKLRKVYRHFRQAFFIAHHLFRPTLFSHPQENRSLYNKPFYCQPHNPYATRFMPPRGWRIKIVGDIKIMPSPPPPDKKKAEV